MSLHLHIHWQISVSEVQWMELVTGGTVKLVLELDPLQTKSMQESRQTLHHHQHSNGTSKEHSIAYNDQRHTVRGYSWILATHELNLIPLEDVPPEYLRQLRVSQ